MSKTKKAVNYELSNIAMNVNGRLSVMPIKVAPEMITLDTGVIVQAICFVKGNGDLGSIQFWTPEFIATSAAEAVVLAAKQAEMRKTFAGTPTS